MAATRSGTEIDCTAQGVELLLEHQSMPSSESVALMALALRNEFTVRKSVPPLKLPSRLVLSGDGTRTVLTISVTMLPSFLRCFWGRVVQQCTSVEISERRPLFR